MDNFTHCCSLLFCAVCRCSAPSPIRIIDYLASHFNHAWDLTSAPNLAEHDRQLRCLFNDRVFPILNRCWAFCMHKGKPCVWEEQDLMSSAPFAIAKLTKEGEFMKTHRDLTVTISMAAFKRKAVFHRLFDIW